MIRKESGNQSANGLNELRLVQSISEKDADELSDTGQEQIGLKGSGTVRFTGIKREGILEDVNGSLNGDSVPVEVVPMVGVSGDAGIEAKVLVGIGVDTLAVSCHVAFFHFYWCVSELSCSVHTTCTTYIQFAFCF